MAQDNTPSIFTCYTDHDKDLRARLDKYLGPLRREGIINAWHDRLIAPGAYRTQTIDTYLDSASIILLLISADFLASDCAPRRCI